jgi:hypothetical protein
VVPLRVAGRAGDLADDADAPVVQHLNTIGSRIGDRVTGEGELQVHRLTDTALRAAAVMHPIGHPDRQIHHRQSVRASSQNARSCREERRRSAGPFGHAADRALRRVRWC